MARLPRLQRTYLSTAELQSAAAAGDAEAMHQLATAHISGTGVDKDRHAAMQLIFRAAEKGHAIAMERLADIYRTGEILQEKVAPIDIDRAIDWYEKSHKAGNHDALFGLARVYQHRQEFKKALKAFHDSAFLYGKREAMREYGMCLYNGNGTPQDVAQGREYIAKAALLDEDFSALGCEYIRQNYGVEVPMPETAEDRLQRKYALENFRFDCLLKRAESGDVDAQVDVAHRYLTGGRQNEKSRERAMHWFDTAARAGDGEAQYELGRAAEAGTGSAPPDLLAAFRWYKQSADSGYGPGAREAGRFLLTGEGGVTDHKQAAKYLERAAAMNDAEAMVIFGKILLEGIGVKKDEARGKAMIDQGLEDDKRGIGLARLRLQMLAELGHTGKKKK